MKADYFVRFSLLITGLIALYVGASISLIPDSFYTSYQINLPEGPSLRSDLRGTGVLLLGVALYILCAVFLRAQRRAAIAVGILVFAAYVVGRGIGLVVDGLPVSTVLGAWATEFIAMVLLLLAWWLDRREKNRN